MAAGQNGRTVLTFIGCLVPVQVEKSKAKEAMPKLMRPPSFVGNEAVTASIIVVS
jgi:hypothetical protein